MKFKFSDKSHGSIDFIEHDGINIPFGKDLGPSIYIKEGIDSKDILLSARGDEFSGMYNDVLFSLGYNVREKFFDITVKIENKGTTAFNPDAIGLKLGIDSYMESYPEWNEKYFPTFLRCEKTHFTGYFESPLGKAVGIICTSAIAAWELDYNKTDGVSDEELDFGHRIYTGNLLLTCKGPLPERHPQNLSEIAPGEIKEWVISLFTLNYADEFYNVAQKDFSLPTIELERYTYSRGEAVKINVKSEEKCKITSHAPSGKAQIGNSITLDEYGLYTITAEDKNGKISSATIYSRHDYGWYLKAARECAVMKPQKASTHTESWYGWFSAFLAAKHYPDADLDRLARENFDEVAPLMFDFEKGVPTVIQSRVQNLALFISVLVDLYESDKEKNFAFLDYADRFAEELLKRQTPDGAYKRNGIHYTSVIYIAKSMLELALAEKELSSDAKYKARYEKHYSSAKAAVDDLAANKERIGTEGEHTLEDGMISCSALQLGFFALTLPEEERGVYIEAAEYLMKIHACLEQRHIPDARMRGATLRFWEAQYDVMIRGNMMNSPHGWTSWKNYATYYLYLLTGKREYLIDTVNTMGACLACVREDRDISWAFIADPYLNVKVLVPDTQKPVKDGLKSVSHIKSPAYRGKYEYKTFGECYVPMISSWYRTADQLITGGYQLCPLIFDDHIENVDNQGGACDNDVHEHFKCLEETLLKKCFVILENGKTEGFGCKAEMNGQQIIVTPFEECEFLHLNLDTGADISILGKKLTVEPGLTMLKLRY